MDFGKSLKGKATLISRERNEGSRVVLTGDTSIDYGLLRR